MILGFLAQRLIWHVVVFTEFSLMLNEAALKIWFPWLEQGSVQVEYVFIDGPNELGYHLIPTGTTSSSKGALVTLSEYRNLLQMRNWGVEPEGEETVLSNPVLNWIN